MPRDFAALRAVYGDREDFDQLCDHDRPIEKLVELTNAGRFQEVLTVAKPWLEQCPVDIDARYVAAAAFAELGQVEEGRVELRWYRGLVESVLASGDGRTPETAFRVISVAEEYSILRALNLRFISQSLTERIDALKVEGDAGQFTLFFDPAPHFRRLDRALGSK